MSGVDWVECCSGDKERLAPCSTVTNVAEAVEELLEGAGILGAVFRLFDGE